MSDNIYDVIIIGGGPAGLTAAIYTTRSKLKTLLIEKMGCGGQVIITDNIENYPGFPEGISGFELSAKFEEQARKFGVEIINDEVTGLIIEKTDNLKTVKTQNSSFKTLTVIISSGANPKKLQVPGEEEFLGKGVSYCATCDGPFFKAKDIIVVGGGDSAVEEAIYLTRFAKKVTLIHRRDRLRAAKLIQDRAFNNPKMVIVLNSIVTKITGDENVKGVLIKNVVDGKEKQTDASGVFIFAGYVPNTMFLKDTLKLDERCYVLTDNDMKTSVPGIFACGDVRNKMLKQVVTAVGDGAAAAFSAQEYVDELKGTSYK
ncbi:MAG: thioredoxin-disulfide reductase [Elusimicrobia bacterium]|nr:thioredoxin-disulfide reductase [Candidatus Liberimonas magnetica]